MGLSVGTAIDDGIGRLRDRRVISAYLAVYAVFLGIMIGTQSQLEAQGEELAAEGALLFGEQFLLEEYPLALDISVGAASVLWLACLVLAVTASVFAFRALVSVDETGDPSDGPATAGLLAATLHGFVAAVVGIVAVGAGLVLLILPGLAVATVLALTHPYIAVDRDGAFEAMARSYETTRGFRLQLFGVLVAIALSFFAVSFLGGFATALLAGAPALGELVNVAFTALAWVLALAILASAFDQVETARSEREEKWADIDDELLP